jgi:hypothetical protein
MLPNNSAASTVSSTIDSSVLTKTGYSLAVITNSRVLQLMNDNFQTVQVLTGHDDVILALDSGSEG